jgi:hypothetical protein
MAKKKIVVKRIKCVLLTKAQKAKYEKMGFVGMAKVKLIKELDLFRQTNQEGLFRYYLTSITEFWIGWFPKNTSEEVIGGRFLKLSRPDGLVKYYTKGLDHKTEWLEKIISEEVIGKKGYLKLTTSDGKVCYFCPDLYRTTGWLKKTEIAEEKVVNDGKLQITKETTFEL